MASVESLLMEAYRTGIEVWLERDELRFRAPKGATDSQEFRRLQASKTAIVAFLRQATRANGHPVIKPAAAAQGPLSFAQEGLWILEQLGSAGPAYNVPLAWRLVGPLNAAALEKSFIELTSRHGVLRSRFDTTEAACIQEILPTGTFRMERMDLPGASEACVQAAIQREIRQLFALRQRPPFRVLLMKLSDSEHVLLLIMHHMVSDGWSVAIMQRELSALYAAYVEGAESALAELPVQYIDYARWQREWMQGEILAKHLQYWKERLSGAPPVLALYGDRPRPAVASFKGDMVPFAATKDLLAALARISRQEGVTPFMTLLAAFQVLLYRYSRQTDIVIGSPIAGRVQRETEGLIGLFANTLALRTDVSGDPTFPQLLRRVKETCLGAYQHQALPFEILVSALHPVRDVSHQPVCQVMFAMQRNSSADELELTGISTRELRSHSATSKVDLTMSISMSETALSGSMEYATDLFDRSTIERMVEHFLTLLRGIAVAPDSGIDALPLIEVGTESDTAVITPAASRGYAPERCVHELISEHARRAPSAVAVSCDGVGMTYEELERRSNQLANHLRSLGVGPERLVAISMDRSAALIVGILGIIKAGGAYVPIDPTYPEERMAYIIEDSGTTLLLCDHPGNASVGKDIPVVCMERDREDIESEAEALPTTGVGLANLIYCIYTSGSTGRPKGSLLTHANVSRLFLNTAAMFGFRSDDVWTLFHSFSFDFSVWEIFGALIHGGRLVITPYLTSRSPEEYARMLYKEGVTVANLTPSAFILLSEALERADHAVKLSALRYVVFGGEALNPATLKPWVRIYGTEHPRLINMYGITETTVHVTFREIERCDLNAEESSPIGVQIPDLTLYVLDERMARVPIGVAGELYVGGAGLARAYHDRPGLTAERFVPNPYGKQPGERLYRTGDVVRRRSDGQLEYLGRPDNQVKLHGFRIELGEIEAALCGYRGVTNAVVCVLGEGGSDRRLVGWVSGNTMDLIGSRMIRAYLSERLPAFMLPSDIVLVDEMPLNGNGKVDRASLIRGYRPSRQVAEDVRAPETPLESALVSIWEEVLQTGPIGTADNFFSLGGDSIRAIQAVQVAKDRQIFFTVALLFKHQCISELARVLGTSPLRPLGAAPDGRWEVPADVVAKAAASGACDVYPVTSMQQVMLERYGGESGIYHVQQSLGVEGHEFCIEAMRSALNWHVAEHVALRTVFMRAEDKSFFQGVLARAHAEIDEHDLTGLGDAEGNARLSRFVQEDKRREFDVITGTTPPYRFSWFRTACDRGVLFMSIHHAIDDGWGNQYFLTELFDKYAAVRLGRKPQPAPRLNVVKELVALEREMAQSRAASDFWKGVDLLPMASRRGTDCGPENPVEIRHCAQSTEGLLTGIRKGCRLAGVSLKAAVLSAYAESLLRLTGEAAITVGVVCNGRSERLSDPLHALGLFWNIVPVTLRKRIFAQPGAEECVQRLLTEVEPFAIYPASNIAQLHGADDLFFATLNFTNFHNHIKAEVGGGITVRYLSSHDRFHYPINCHVGVQPTSRTLAVNMEFDPYHFSKSTVAALTDDFLGTLARRATARSDA